MIVPLQGKGIFSCREDTSIDNTLAQGGLVIADIY